MKTSSSKQLSPYEKKLLEGWEDIYKKGQLTFWVLFALRAGNKHMAQIKEFIHDATNGTMSVDDQSMYRALRRYDDAELVSFCTTPSESGPDLKVYELTIIGCGVLETFIERNITGVYLKPEILKQLKSNPKVSAQ